MPQPHREPSEHIKGRTSEREKGSHHGDPTPLESVDAQRESSASEAAPVLP